MTLIKVIHDKNNPYLTVNTTITNDSSLSYKAIGIWFYAFSKKDDWKFYMSDLVKRHTDGKLSVRTGLQELEKAGYLHRVQNKDEKGRYGSSDWIFFETPKSPSEIQKMFPKSDFQTTDNRTSENQPLVINDCSVSNKEKKFVSEQSSLSKIKIQTGKGEKEIPQEEMFRLAVTKKFNATTEELQEAWKVLASYKNIVYDWWRFIEGTIEKYRNLKRSENICKSNKKKLSSMKNFKKNVSEKISEEQQNLKLVYPWANQKNCTAG